MNYAIRVLENAIDQSKEYLDRCGSDKIRISIQDDIVDLERAIARLNAHVPIKLTQIQADDVRKASRYISQLILIQGMSENEKRAVFGQVSYEIV